MTVMTSGQNGYGKYLKSVLLLSLLFLLVWNSVLWAGPMGDPEPVGANDPQAPIGSPADSRSGAQQVPTAVSDVELVIIILHALL